MIEKEYNKYVKLRFFKFGRCQFVADLGWREERLSDLYEDEQKAKKDYQRGSIAWQITKQKRKRF